MKELIECDLCKKPIKRKKDVYKYKPKTNMKKELFIFHNDCKNYITRLAKTRNLNVDELLLKYYNFEEK